MQNAEHTELRMEEPHISSKPPKKNKNKKKQKNNLMNIKSIKRPQTAYFLFCSKMREKTQKSLSAKELGKMWVDLPEKEKKKYRDQYEKNMKEYLKKLEELNKSDKEEESSNEEESNNKYKFSKVMAKTKKNQNFKNKYQECNCGECDDCKIRKQKKEEEEEEIKDNMLAKMKAKKVVDDEDDDD